MSRTLSAAIALVATLGLAPGVTAQSDTIAVSADATGEYDTIGAADG